MCSMGVGTNILGYANNEVDNAVIENIKKVICLLFCVRKNNSD